MFRRRENLTILQRMWGVIWPRMGWLRAGAYFRHRVARLPGSAYSIAAGLACGAAVSFMPFIGLHFVLAAVIAWLIGGNVIASALGTAVGNPWTFPLIWWGILRIGELIMGSSQIASVPEHITLHFIFNHPFAVLLPMTIGGAISGAVVWLAVYFSSYYLVERYQRARANRLRRRREAATTVTGPGAGEGLVP